jgi:GDP-L-fucose synthase
MFSNLLLANNNHGIFVNFCSGAAFDRRYEINKADESSIVIKNPIDHYGLAKNLIAKEIFSKKALKAINLRLFGCFGKNEPEHRLIKSTINKINLGDNPVIINDRLMDFFYVKDVLNVIDYAFCNSEIFPRDVNLVYEEKINLLSIAKYVSYTMDGKDPVCLNTELEKPYTGDGKLLTSLPIQFTGLWAGIKEVIEDVNTNR